MAAKPLPPQEVLRQLLRYEPETGKLFWKERPVGMFTATESRTQSHAQAHWNARHAGKEAMIGNHNTGYKWGRIFGRPYLAHRVIWKLVHGYDPAEQIDHINGDRSDNRISNLREASALENGKNGGMRRNNSSGYKGVCWVKRDRRWAAAITSDGKHISLGHHRCPTAAAVAYRKAAQRLHGAFMRSA